MCKFCKLCNCFSNKSAINPTGNKMSVNGNDYLNHAIAKAMWIPSKSNTNMMDFLHVVNETYDVKLGKCIFQRCFMVVNCKSSSSI